MVAQRWSFRYSVEPSIPPLAWLARIENVSGVISVTLGESVRREEMAFFEGTWVGESGLPSLPASTTAFGSGMVAGDFGALVITPTHSMSGVYAMRSAGELVVSNSLTALLTATTAELDRDADYSSLLFQTIEGVYNSPIRLPSSNGTVEHHYYWNLSVGADGTLSRVARPRVAAFNSFGDYRSRLSAAVASIFANAPGYTPAVAVSSGYDSTCVAAVAAERGCRRALTFREGRLTSKTGPNINDSGKASAIRLGMDVETFDRLYYRARTDLPEAEFLSTGMSAEDVIMSAFEPSLAKGLLLTGTQGNGVWRLGGSRREDLSRQALDGASLQEFRLRVDFCFVPLPVFGLDQRPSIMDISASTEMKPFSVGGHYDQPIARRIAEEAGLPRGTFAVSKHAASALIHSAGESELAPATAAAIRVFAAAEGTTVAYPAPSRGPAWRRLVLRKAPGLGLGDRVGGLKSRQKRFAQFQPGIGNLLLRWGVSVVQPRYAALAPADTVDGGGTIAGEKE